jgi:hypothetical protein
MGVLVSAQTTNQTIDDTAWRNWTVILTPGWNMLEKNASNWINTVSRSRPSASSSNTSLFHPTFPTPSGRIRSAQYSKSNINPDLAQTQFDNEEKTAFRDFNSSISWTEQANAGNAVLFNGEAVWAYGIVGGEAG